MSLYLQIDFIRFKNMKFAYSLKLFHVIEQNNRDKTYWVTCQNEFVTVKNTQIWPADIDRFYNCCWQFNAI